ncbi:CAMK family protein kinase [Trichomonas vaginalis G3]|uniref:CAMK family protein kinase n=1 Tax=Trichomonas vaginalis (strain ATCC PRA-98 / G3) TaxID=412133 RepID=A2G3H5_TRIV3|nr:protein serine/threonine kinase protein [Trichomonas vaginalis G3]EAX88292.1 CAMK family protein kinase [Trichomonas vaginalis G3]KAI5531895.1 protein serine/threonine kinase protein [Trichomonas vaginalis G3]|eukprot:XP_001301222.1 CAMK family protein kinase [Trichomonas vaginalis G3]
MQESISDYIFGQTIGEGSTGKVKIAVNKNTNKTLAIKMVKKSIIANKPVVLSNMKREIAIMRLLNHPNLLHLESVFENNEYIFLVEQLAQYGSLFDIVMSLNYDQSIAFFRQIIYGLEYLHNKSICHRDLKLENLLLIDPETLAIADFGLACWMPNNIASTYCGSPHYTAPEVTYDSTYDGRIADIWSAGVILYMMLTKTTPFQGNSMQELIQNIRMANFVPPNISPDADDLIYRILTPNPQNRITIKDIKIHPLFRHHLPDDYILPSPLPMACLPSPFEASEYERDTLQSIGFPDSEIKTLYSDGSSRIKAFAEIIRSGKESILWDAAIPAAHPIGSPYESFLIEDDKVSLLKQRRVIGRISANLESIAYQMQVFVRETDFDWLHTDINSIVARRGNHILRILSFFRANARYVEVVAEGMCAEEFSSIFTHLSSILMPFMNLSDNTILSDMNAMMNERLAMPLEGY